MHGMQGGGPGGGGRFDDISDARATYNPEIVARALSYVRPYRGSLWLAFVLTLVAAGMHLWAPILIKIAIDDHIAVGDLGGLAWVMLLILIIYVVQYLALAEQIRVVSLAGQKLLRTLREQLFEHLQRLSLSYYSRNKTGVIVSRLINDVAVMNDLLSHGILNLIGDVVMLVGTIVLMVSLSPRLALATLAVMPVMGIAVWVFTQRAKVAFRKTRQTIGAVAADFQESIDGARVLQAFAREEVSQTQFDRLNQENRVANIQANTLSSMLIPVVEFTNALAIVVVIWYGGLLAISGEVTLGVLVAFLTYVSRFFQPIRELTQFYNQLQGAMAGAERVFELLDEPITVAERPNAVVLPRVQGAVELQQIWFSYGERPVLKDITFRAEPGEMIALVGHTGAGKTTIASLLARFYDPTAGQVLLDGHDLRDLSFQTLRQNVAVVLQENFLFAGTVAENIRFGKPEASDEDVMKAARAAHAHSFISHLPEGYETKVMERAANFSLGQRQLIAIARAVLADPRVLILDEATSSVDPRTEQRLQHALRSLLVGRTALVIAHRLSTIEAADEVLLLENGEIIERGNHHQLLDRRGPYYRLYQQQFAAQPQALAS